ncbi:hypothetical protein GQ651_13575 [Alphaproteobacteria bacterium GH1-50]|uniref:DUF4157 domain-containing protein n=1 Tax=Kangsaoukella pontilimi TaxID=2691042 RepID=A0A7C9IRL5_9RHOB|nr:hypothetical protein [Kangsaoukella pontilimi]MXQ08883.1 hypothetical protein [Kangsaoukella pontilimi]
MRSTGLFVFLLLILAACSRPLTENEEAFARDLFGETLDTDQVTVTQGLGLAPLYRTLPSSVKVLRGTDRACLRTPQPRGAQPPQAFALHNRVSFDSQLYSSDMARAWPQALRFPQALVLAHELTHVWQWQNREMTGYTPARAVAESFRLADPYYSGDATRAPFLTLGYEQQAAVVEDFVCFTVANPDHPRRTVLREALEPFFPVAAFERAVGG